LEEAVAEAVFSEEAVEGHSMHGMASNYSLKLLSFRLSLHSFREATLSRAQALLCKTFETQTAKRALLPAAKPRHLARCPHQAPQENVTTPHPEPARVQVQE
jgi:hypothetical protein